MNKTDILTTIKSFTAIEQVFDYFEIGYDSQFINLNRIQIIKRFNGYLIIDQPNDWFAARRALKNAYCRVQRSQLDKTTRQACRGCTSCQRR